MRLPMFALAAGCLAIGLLAPFVVETLRPVLANVAGQTSEAAAENLGAATASLSFIIAGASLLFCACLRWLCCAEVCWPAARVDARRHLGLRLHGPNAACAIHRLLFRATAHPSVPLGARNKDGPRAAVRLFSRPRGIENRDARFVPRQFVSAGFSENEMGDRPASFHATRPRPALCPLYRRNAHCVARVEIPLK